MDIYCIIEILSWLEHNTFRTLHVCSKEFRDILCGNYNNSDHANLTERLYSLRVERWMPKFIHKHDIFSWRVFYRGMINFGKCTRFNKDGSETYLKLELDYALLNRRILLSSILIYNNIEPNMIYLIRTGYLDLIEYVLKRGYVIKKIHVAISISERKIAILELFVQYGVKFEHGDLYHAARGDNIESVKFLVKNGLKLTPDFIGHCVYHSNVKILKYAIQQGEKIPKEDYEIAQLRKQKNLLQWFEEEKIKFE